MDSNDSNIIFIKEEYNDSEIDIEESDYKLKEHFDGPNEGQNFQPVPVYKEIQFVTCDQECNIDWNENEVDPLLLTDDSKINSQNEVLSAKADDESMEEIKEFPVKTDILKSLLIKSNCPAYSTKFLDKTMECSAHAKNQSAGSNSAEGTQQKMSAEEETNLSGQQESRSASDSFVRKENLSNEIAENVDTTQTSPQCRALQKPHGKNKFKCSYCDYSNACKLQLAKHANIHIEDTLFNGSKCQFPAHPNVKLVHRSSSHTINSVTKNSLTNKEPPVCPTKTPSMCRPIYKKSNFDNFLKSRAKSFYSFNHCQNVETPIKCSECNYYTNKTANLKQHSRVHRIKKNFKCHLCSYETFRNFWLVKHYEDFHSSTSTSVPTVANHT